MKIAVAFIILLPLVTPLPAPTGSTFNSVLNAILNVFHANEVKQIVTDLYHSLGTNERKAECMKECDTLVDSQLHAGSFNILGHSACSPICTSFQELVHHFDIAPQTGGTTGQRAVNVKNFPIVS